MRPANGRADVQISAAAFRDNPVVVMREAVEARTENSIVKAISRLEGQDTLLSLQAGDLSLELAFGPDKTDDERLAWLSRAEHNWQHAVNLNRLANYEVDRSSGMALVQLAHMPAYYWRTMFDTLPSPEVTQQVYQNLLGVGQAHADSFHTLRANNSKRANAAAQELSGNMAEIATLLLLHRFSLELNDQSWAATPSFISEDRKQGRVASVNRHWDISVFTHTDDQPELTYKVQVKTSTNNQDEKSHIPYADDITMVYLQPDLRLSKQDRFGSSVIISECAVEYESGGQAPRVSDQLNARTEKLLNILG